MQPKFPVLRSFLTAFILALIAAAGTVAVGRLTVPAIAESQPEVAASGSAREIGEMAVKTLADLAGEPAAGDSTATGDGTAAADSSAAGDGSAAGGNTAAADSSAAGDSTAAAAGGDSTALAVADPTGAATAATSGAASKPIWPTSLEAILNAPDRWLFLAAFGLTFLAALITSLAAVKGSAPEVVEEGPVHRRSDAVQLLAVLQREGRLVDFLRESIDPYSDDQIGAAVRAVHAGCRKALEEHMTLQPVMSEDEGTEVTVVDGFDPSAVRLTGNVSGDPPFTGALRHRGWRASEVDLPTDARGQDPGIVVPAEVEVP